MLAVPFRVLPGFKVIGALRLLVGVVSVRLPAPAFALASIAALTVMLLSAWRLTLLPSSAVTIVAAAIVESAVLLVPATIVPVPPVPTTSRLAGSRSQVPFTPWGERVLTVVLGAIVRLFPEVSMKPPLPLSAPPSAERRPVTRVFSAFARMFPPFPTVPASAFRRPASVSDPAMVDTGMDVPVKVTTPLLIVRPVALAKFPPVSRAGRV